MLVITAIIKLLIILCVVATIHEFGHFIAAKMLKVGVNEFSIGFGPKIVQKKYKETMYSLRWLPLGGYVMIEGEGEHSDSENSFEKKNALEKIIILVMGVVFNCILATVLLFGSSFAYDTYTSNITKLADNSVLIEAGISEGDTITKINSKDINLYQDFSSEELLKSENTTITFIHNGEEKEVTINNARRKIGYIGVQFDASYENEVIIANVQKGYVSDKAGLKANDKIVKIDGEEVTSSAEVVSYIRERADEEVVLTILREDEEQEITLIPSYKFILDLGIEDARLEKTTLKFAMLKTGNVISQIITSYASMFSGNVSLDDVSSIVGIGAAVSETKGIIEFLQMMALISFAIGIANILPILPLDGGKVLFVLIEAISRKKVPEKVEIAVTYVGFGALMLLTVIVTCKDIINIF